MLIECSFKAIHLTTGSLKDRFISRHQAKTCQQSTTTVDPPDYLLYALSVCHYERPSFFPCIRLNLNAPSL